MKNCPTCGGSGTFHGGAAPTTCFTCNGSGLDPNPNPGSNNSFGNNNKKSSWQKPSDDACFTGESLVYTIAGWRRIDSIDESDLIYSLDDNGLLRVRPVLKRVQHVNCEAFSVRNGQYSFGAASSHSVNVSARRWKRLSQLKLDSELKYIHGQTVAHGKIDNIKSIGKQTVHNLIVADNFNFIVSGCIAHSFTHFRRSRMFLWSAYVLLRKLKFAINRASV